MKYIKKTTKKKIDKKLVKKWIEALESGKYKKCIHVLHRTKNTFCALGVLCDVYDPTKWKKENHFYCYDDTSYFVPTHDILNTIGMKGDIEETITDLNDNKRASFKEIAKYLRELYNIKN